jgi:hypothetical protein
MAADNIRLHEIPHFLNVEVPGVIPQELLQPLRREPAAEDGDEHLGPPGSVMVAETFVGVMFNEGHSYLANDADWHPGLPVPGASTRGIFAAGDQSTISDLLRFAGVMPADVTPVASGGARSSDAA